MSGMRRSWHDAAQPGTNEPDDLDYERRRCACGAFLPWDPSHVGERFMAWRCKRCARTLVEEEPALRTVEGDPF